MIHYAKKGVPYGITSVLSVVATLAMLQTDYFSLKNDRLDTTYKRINALEKRLDSVNSSLRDRAGELALLRAQLSSKQTPTKVLINYLEALQTPAWIKTWNPDTKKFTMFYLNSAYEYFYGITKARYIGATDFDVRSDKEAEALYRSDLAIIKNKNFWTFEQALVDASGDKVRKVTLWKFFLELPGEVESVGVIQVDSKKENKKG